MNIKYKVKKQATTTHHIAIADGEQIDNTKKYEELEVKAKAFDNLIERCDEIYLETQGYTNTQYYLVIRFRYFNYTHRIPIPKEAYETLKKAGVE